MASSPSRLIKKRGLANYDKHVSSRLEGLLTALLGAEKRPRAEHDHIPTEPGLYLFSDAKSKPIYVGQSRNIRSRLGDHCRPSAPENAASFAFNIAKREAHGQSIDIAGFNRKALSTRADFKALFDDAKAKVALMPVQFVVEPHADLRTVFEVYATYALGTQEYNTFETH
jgi:GIY-YIG catalytic domain